MWDWMVFNLAIICVQFCDYSCCYVYCDCEFFEVRVFNTFGIGVACNYLFPFYFFEGHRGLLSWICTYTHIHMHAYTNAESCHMHMICRAYTKESCHAWIICHIHMIRHTYESVMSHIARDDATNEHVYVYEWAMSTNIICHIYQCSISNIYDAWRIWISHVTHDRGRCTRWASIYDMSHVSMSHLTHMNASCFTYK